MTLRVKKIDEACKGVFTDLSYESENVVLKFSGKVLSKNDVNLLTKEQQSDVLQIGLDKYLDLSKETSFFVRHNCNPNCYVKVVANNAFLIALRPIKVDDEITFDYSLTSTDSKEEWLIKCVCNKYHCRKVISGFNEIVDDKKKEFIKKGVVPRYIRDND